MVEYPIYLETGPKRRRTLVHVPSLPGCTGAGPTTDDAVASAPGIVREYLRFLAHHGASVDPDARIATPVAEISEAGGFLANTMFEPDRRPMTSPEIQEQARWLGWLQAETLRLVEGADPASDNDSPSSGGRPLGRIVAHVIGAEYSYLTATHFRTPGLSAIGTALDRGQKDARDAFRAAHDLVQSRLAQATDEELDLVIEHPSSSWTTRKMLRRMLEHRWEHHCELRARVR